MSRDGALGSATCCLSVYRKGELAVVKAVNLSNLLRVHQVNGRDVVQVG